MSFVNEKIQCVTVDKVEEVWGGEREREREEIRIEMKYRSKQEGNKPSRFFFAATLRGAIIREKLSRKKIARLHFFN